MKKTALLQSDLSYLIATMGHLDTLVTQRFFRRLYYRNVKT